MNAAARLVSVGVVLAMSAACQGANADSLPAAADHADRKPGRHADDFRSDASLKL